MKPEPGDRDIPPGETNWPCHVGSGECLQPAVRILTGYCAGDFYVCAAHLPEVIALSDILEAKPELCEHLEAAIKQVE